jgi:flavin reductase (DIM6/NTAB) family NADH-FMN oxidoreductase RutF
LTLMDRDPGDAGGISARNYRALMRHQAGAVAVVATITGDMRAGLTATAFSSLSDQPPTLLVCVQRKSGAHDIIAGSKVFSVNILAADQQDVAMRFSGQGGVRGEARFDGHAWGQLKTGAPVLDHALAVLDCELVESHGFTTHTIFIGRVVDGATRSEAEPLLYFRGDYWNLGER